MAVITCVQRTAKLSHSQMIAKSVMRSAPPAAHTSAASFPRRREPRQSSPQPLTRRTLPLGSRLRGNDAVGFGAVPEPASGEQRWVEIVPIWVHLFYQPDFPRPVPFLQPLLPQ